MFFIRSKKKNGLKNFKVFFYGSFLPLHGIDYIMKVGKNAWKRKMTLFLKF